MSISTKRSNPDTHKNSNVSRSNLKFQNPNSTQQQIQMKSYNESPTYNELKPGLKQIGKNIIDPSIRTEDEEFLDIDQHRKKSRFAKRVEQMQIRNEPSLSNSDNEDNDDEEEIEIDQQLQENVIRYTNLYDLLKEKKKEMLEIRKQMNEPKQLIIQFFARADVNQLNVTDGKLIKNVSKKKKSLKEDIIKEAIKKTIKDDDNSVTEAIIENINDIRSTTENTNVSLKRTYNKS